LRRKLEEENIPVIRVADASDLPALIKLIEHYWEFERIKGFDAANIATVLNDLFRSPDRGQIWVAQDGGRSVGYLLAVYLFSLEHGGLMAEIDEFFVTPEKRSLKIGAALLDAATAAMTQRGISHIQLQLGTHNAHGKRFYEQHGFEQLSEYTLLYKSLQLG
jgi:GNAT superfamily N-acetyltransferase